MKTIPYILATSALVTLNLSAQLINWEHNSASPYLPSNTQFPVNGQNFAAPSGNSATLAYNDSSSVFTNGVNSYSGPTMYVGAHLQLNVPIAGDAFYRIIYRTGDGARFQFNNNGNGDAASSATYSTVSMFLKDDFINGFDSSNDLFFSTTDSLSLKFTASSATRDIRFVVRDGNDYYISQQASTAIGLNTPLDFIMDFSGGNGDWAAWDPTGVVFDSGSAVFSAHEFTDITGVGFYASSTTGGNGMNMDLRHFTASATAVPEPATYALILGTIASFLIIRRRRMN